MELTRTSPTTLVEPDAPADGSFVRSDSLQPLAKGRRLRDTQQRWPTKFEMAPLDGDQYETLALARQGIQLGVQQLISQIQGPPPTNKQEWSVRFRCIQQLADYCWRFQKVSIPSQKERFDKLDRHEQKAILVRMLDEINTELNEHDVCSHCGHVITRTERP